MSYSYTPTYVTYDTFKLDTNVTALSSVAEDAFKKLAKRAEMLIDNYVGTQDKYDMSQTRQFPRYLDLNNSGVAEIPAEVEMSCIRIIESLYLDGETKAPTANNMISETIDGYSYSKGKTSAETKGTELIPPEAMNLLNKFKRNAVQISPDASMGNGQLNSRQKFMRTL